MSIRVLTLELGDFGTNCYVVTCTETGESAVIDPGAPSAKLERSIKAGGLAPRQVWLTHGHLDHIGGVALIKSLFGATVAVHGDDAPMLTDPMKNGSAYFGAPVTAPAPDRLLHDGDTVTAGKLSFTVIHTPGHTPGGICLYLAPSGAEPGHLFAGDTLFAGSIGRTDLYGGNHEALIRSIKTRLLALPDETVVYPGHGPTTTIGDEREYNPFF